MNKPITTNSGAGYGDVSDHEIEELLASRVPKWIEEGLKHLDAKKRPRWFGLLRIWSDRRDWRLSGEDVADVWTDTMSSIWVRSVLGVFTVRDQLDGLISTIAYRRAIDLIRERIRDYDRKFLHKDMELIAGPTQREAAQTVQNQYRRLLERRFWSRLSRKEQRVICYLIDYAAKKDRLPSIAELTASINRNRTADDRMTHIAVKSAKQRAIEKLRDQGGEEDD